MYDKIKHKKQQLLQRKTQKNERCELVMPEKIKGIKDEKYLENFSKAIPSTFITSETKKLLNFASKGYVVQYSNILKNYSIKRMRDYNCVLLIFSPIVVMAKAVIDSNTELASDKRTTSNTKPVDDAEIADDTKCVGEKKTKAERFKESYFKEEINLIDQILNSAKFKLLCNYIGAGEGSKISELLRKFPEYKKLFVFFSSETKYTELIKRAQNISGWRTNGNYIKTKLIPFINHVIGQKFGNSIDSSMQKQERISDEDACEPYATPEQERAMYVFKLITTEFKKHKLENSEINIVLNSPISVNNLSEKTNYKGHTNKFNIFTDIKKDKFNVWFDKEELTNHYTDNKTQLLEDVITYCDLIREVVLLTRLAEPKNETPPVLPQRNTRPPSLPPRSKQKTKINISLDDKPKQPSDKPDYATLLSGMNKRIKPNPQTTPRDKQSEGAKDTSLPNKASDREWEDYDKEERKAAKIEEEQKKIEKEKEQKNEEEEQKALEERIQKAHEERIREIMEKENCDRERAKEILKKELEEEEEKRAEQHKEYANDLAAVVIQRREKMNSDSDDESSDSDDDWMD